VRAACVAPGFARSLRERQQLARPHRRGSDGFGRRDAAPGASWGEPARRDSATAPGASWGAGARGGRG